MGRSEREQRLSGIEECFGPNNMAIARAPDFALHQSTANPEPGLLRAEARPSRFGQLPGECALP